MFTLLFILVLLIWLGIGALLLTQFPDDGNSWAALLFLLWPLWPLVVIFSQLGLVEGDDDHGAPDGL